MTEFRQGSVQCLSTAGLHRMAYVEWGDPANPRVLVCVHGLTRCGRDFDDLARALCHEYRVVCPDVAGRGKSDRLKDPRLYSIPQYCADMVTLLARLNAETVHWLGTSMGGLIGMGLAAQESTPISRLVLNDVGPVISATALARIGEYLGKPARFESMAQAIAVMRIIAAPFGPLREEQWRHLTEHSVRLGDDGRYEFIYDPALAIAFQEAAAATDGKDMELWPLYDAIRCPTLVVRGAESDLLSRETAQAMGGRGPKAAMVEFAGIGHAPVLMDPEQITPIREFLLA
jgi:pimeloyl-ACP methyl ester carboxylesterase